MTAFTSILLVIYSISFLEIIDVLADDGFEMGDCAKETHARSSDVNNFRKHIPQMTENGKCFVDCVYKKNGVVSNGEVNLDELNKHHSDPDIVSDCARSVTSIPTNTCRFAASLNSCIEIKTKAATLLKKPRVSRRRMQDDEFVKREYYYGVEKKGEPMFPIRIPPILFAQAQPIQRDDYNGISVPYKSWRRS